MLNLFALHEKELLYFGLILIRMIAFVLSSAIFGQNTISIHLKILLSICLSIVVFPSVKIIEPLSYQDLLILHVIREALVGLILGFFTKIFFFVLSMTGELLATTMGLSSSQLFNPVMGTHSSAIEQFYTILATVLFLILDGHHVFISGIISSVKLLPVGDLSFQTAVLGSVAQTGGNLMTLTVQFCSPLIITTLIANFSMAILGKAVPQINVFVTSVPVTILLGLLVLIITLPLMVDELSHLIMFTQGKLFQLIKEL